jgi:hypothetical protein
MSRFAEVRAQSLKCCGLRRALIVSSVLGDLKAGEYRVYPAGTEDDLYERATGHLSLSAYFLAGLIKMRTNPVALILRLIRGIPLLGISPGPTWMCELPASSCTSTGIPYMVSSHSLKRKFAFGLRHPYAPHAGAARSHNSGTIHSTFLVANIVPDPVLNIVVPI